MATRPIIVAMARLAAVARQAGWDTTAMVRSSP